MKEISNFVLKFGDGAHLVIWMDRIGTQIIVVKIHPGRNPEIRCFSFKKIPLFSAATVGF